MSYKVIYHLGDSGPTLKTIAFTGRLYLYEHEFTVDGRPSVTVPYDSLRAVELFRLHGTGRMLKVAHDGGNLFVSVLRFTLFGGRIARVAFFDTGELRQALIDRMTSVRHA